VIDEFTGSLDRTVAKTTSAALSRLVRTLDSFRFVAVTCHHDILRWLAPDWILELGPNTSPKRKRGDCGRNLEGARFGGTTSNTLAGAAGLCARLIRQRPRKPRLYLQLDRVPQALWSRFQAQHYLSGGLAASATCYAAFWNKEPLVFCAVVAALGWPGVKRIQRLVTLPEFQGLGIGGQMLDKVAQGESGRGFRVTITASHPAILAHCSRSPRWRFMDVKKNGSTRQRFGDREIRSSLGRAVAAFEFVSGE
jgi:GNAT superfamily N-acetyltransferase